MLWDGTRYPSSEFGMIQATLILGCRVLGYVMYRPPPEIVAVEDLRGHFTGMN